MRAPGNKNKFRTDLHAYQTRELELFVQMSVKVLHHRYSVSICNIETSISGALGSQSLDETLSIGVMRTIWNGDLDSDALKEILETRALGFGKPARVRTCGCPLPLRKSRQSEIKFPCWYIASVEMLILIRTLLDDGLAGWKYPRHRTTPGMAFVSWLVKAIAR
jgi:hypothetical protein